MADASNMFLPFAAAFVRGTLGHGIVTPLSDLTEAELEAIVNTGMDAGLRLHRFKRTMGLKRVERVLGILRGLQPESLLDIGSGRGAFLWPLMDALPELPVSATDILPHRLRDLHAVNRGGVDRLQVLEINAQKMPFPDRSFDGVSFLETLEHIPDPQAALSEAVRVARRFVILSVPSRPDDNPEHIHLFDEPSLRTMCEIAGAANANFQWVLNHMIVVISVGQG